MAQFSTIEEPIQTDRMSDFAERLRQFDLTLFQYVTSQSTDGDRYSLLALQTALRQVYPSGFTCLEIGSYMGGSLQSFVADPICTRIISIDPRPMAVSDERGTWDYPQNTTQNMLKQLGRVPGADIKKIATFEKGTDQLAADELGIPPNFCFIDGEHTDAAVLRDSLFCLEAIKGQGCIAYHDADIIYDGLTAFIRELENKGRRFRAFNFPDSLFMIEVEDFRVSESPAGQELRRQSYKGYLASMRGTRKMREFYTWPYFQLYRRFKSLIWRLFFAPTSKRTVAR
jgi:hypothetical protein